MPEIFPSGKDYESNIPREKYIRLTVFSAELPRIVNQSTANIRSSFIYTKKVFIELEECSNLSAGSCSPLINPGSVCHFSHPKLQSYTIIIIGLNSVVKSLLPMSVDKSRKLFVAKILRLHYFYQKSALTPLQG